MTDPSRSDLQNRYKELITRLAAVIRISHIHDQGNDAVLRSRSAFRELANRIIEEQGGLSVKLVGDYVFVNDERLRYNFDAMASIDYLVSALRDRKVGEIAFHGRLGETHVKIFAAAFNEAEEAEDPFAFLVERFENSIIAVERLRKPAEENLDRRRMVRRSYFNAVSYAKGVMSKVKAGERISLRKSKRVVEGLVDLVIKEEALLLGMTAIKDYDEYTYNHSVNVSILAVALGQRLGLRKRTLEQIGIASLFHDVGKVEIPEQILNKPSAFTDEEWEVIRKHPEWGFRAILRFKGIDESSIRTALVAYQHHMHFDRKGYPRTGVRIEHTLISEIVTIADNYDAMTSSRVYARVPLSPDRALSMLLDFAGQRVHPALAKVFVNMVGIFPQGSLVLLDTREMGLVFETSPDPAYLDRPRVVIVMDAAGRRLPSSESYTVDLAEQDEGGRFRRSIVRTLDPNQYGVNLSDFLM